MTFNGNKIDLPRVVIIKLQEKFKIRLLMNTEPLLFHLMLKTRNYMVHFGSRHARDCIIKPWKHINSRIPKRDRNFKMLTIQIIFQMACILQPKCNFLHRFFRSFLSDHTSILCDVNIDKPPLEVCEYTYSKTQGH